MGSAMKKAGLKSSFNTSRQNKRPFANHVKNVLQNRFLSELQTRKRQIEVRSIDGTAWVGILSDYDDFSILIKSENGSEKELIFKHSIRSIKPS